MAKTTQTAATDIKPWNILAACPVALLLSVTHDIVRKTCVFWFFPVGFKTKTGMFLLSTKVSVDAVLVPTVVV